MEVLLAPLPDSQVVSTWLWYRVGSRNEEPGTTGAAHWLEHMLFKGSRRYPRGALDRAVIQAGGNLNAFTDTDFTAYFTVLPKERAELPLSLEADRMTGATIPAEEIAKERNVVLSEREMNENTPEFRVEEELFATAFQVHPYRWSPLGYVQDIRRMDREHLLGFYRRFYGPRNATLVISGGFDSAWMRGRVEKHFSRVENPVASPHVATEEPSQRARRETTVTGPGSTPIVTLAWHAPAIAGKAAPAALLLDLYLGGGCPLYTPGYAWGRSRDHPSSRLYQALVDRKLAVHAGSEWHASIQPGLFSIGAQAAPGVRVERVEEALLSEVERLRRWGIPAARIRELKHALSVQASTVWTGATMVGFRYGYFRSLGALVLEPKLLDRALRLGREEVLDEARTLFDGGVSLVRYLPEGTGVLGERR